MTYEEKLAEIRSVPRSLPLTMLAKAFVIFAPYLYTSQVPYDITEPLEWGNYHGTIVVPIPYDTVSDEDRLRLAELCWFWGPTVPTNHFYLCG